MRTQVNCVYEYSYAFVYIILVHGVDSVLVEGIKSFAY